MTLVTRDKHSIWHPFTQVQTADDPIAIVRGEGIYLYDEHNKAYVDLISSWWVNLHGHSEPTIAQAIFDQAKTLEQVIFSGFTHAPAVELAEALKAILPAALTRVFYSDNGSTAIEVALKMAYQYAYNRGEPERKLFLTFEGGYHGDTFGSMAIGMSSNFFKPFEDFCFEVLSLPYPHTWWDDEDIAEKEAATFAAIETYLQQYDGKIAALMVEPLIQGAGGMRFCRPEFLKRVVQRVQAASILVIFDEVMTGFGRTGSMFALEQVGVVPDIICLSKCLTGGFLPLAVTIAKEFIFDAFRGETFDTAFMHGHSYTANPLGCAAACASLKLLHHNNALARIREIEKVHQQRVRQLCDKTHIVAPRVLGLIAAFNIDNAQSDYHAQIGQTLKAEFLKQGLLLRPLGNTVYLMPPYCITNAQLHEAYDKIEKIVIF